MGQATFLGRSKLDFPFSGRLPFRPKSPHFGGVGCNKCYRRIFCLVKNDLTAPPVPRLQEGQGYFGKVADWPPNQAQHRVRQTFVAGSLQGRRRATPLNNLPRRIPSATSLNTTIKPYSCRVGGGRCGRADGGLPVPSPHGERAACGQPCTAGLPPQQPWPYSFQDLEGAVSACPAMWVDGYPGEGDAAFAEMEAALMTAGELLALLVGKRNLVLCQLWTPVVPTPVQRRRETEQTHLRAAQFVFKPYVLRLLRLLAADKRFRILSSYTGKAVTAILYRAEAPHPQRARFLQSLGAQAAVVAESAYYKALIGRILGYSDANIYFHLRSHGHVPSQEIADLVDKDLQKIDKGPLLLPDFTKLPPAASEEGRLEELLVKGQRRGSRKVGKKPAGFGNRS
eukprot:jgi/Botrbrau1/13247/Bobra.0199s0014.1